MAFSAQVGVTALLDQTLVAVATGTLDPASLDPQPTHALFNLNHYRMYDAWLALHAEGKAFVRLQINFLHNQGFIPELGGLDHQLPELRERLKNQFPFFGDDMLRTGAHRRVGGAVRRARPTRTATRSGTRRSASSPRRAGATRTPGRQPDQHAPTSSRSSRPTRRWTRSSASRTCAGACSTPTSRRRTSSRASRRSTAACRCPGFRWLNGVPRADGLPVGPLFPQIVASGIPAGLHEDGVHIAPHNPWFALHYATTGLNVLGQQINPGQQITRQQALHAYTRGERLVPEPRGRSRLDRGGQARRPRRARPRLLHGQRRRDAHASARSSPWSTARWSTTPACWMTAGTTTRTISGTTTMTTEQERE